MADSAGGFAAFIKGKKDAATAQADNKRKAVKKAAKKKLVH